jgi:hypothetical protein
MKKVMWMAAADLMFPAFQISREKTEAYLDEAVI